MSTTVIPPFVKNMGHRILSFVLNIDEDSAQNLVEDNLELDEKRAEILVAFTETFRQLRLQSIDQGDVDSSVFFPLSQLVQNDRHIFNLWREESGGQRYVVDTADPVISTASKIALEVYPLCLIRLPSSSPIFMHNYMRLHSMPHRLSDYGILQAQVLDDPSLRKLFTTIGKDEMDTVCQYQASTGRGGSFQLAVFPSMIIGGAHELMRLKGTICPDAMIGAVQETVRILRDIGEGRPLEVPVFTGFHNVGCDDFTEMDVEYGKVRPYSQELLELVPNDARPSTLGGEKKFLGFVLESKYPYEASLGPGYTWNDHPAQWERARRGLEVANENMSFALALSTPRIPPVGATPAWTLIFDPLCQGPNITWRRSVYPPTPHYLLKDSEQESIKCWAKIICEGDDERIRIAIRRILSSINDRRDPIDGFVDAVIAWENLFGGNAELSYRISVSIARLLGATQDERQALQKTVAKLYGVRSRVVHGSIEMEPDEAIAKRNECLNIALEVTRRLYQDHPAVVVKSNETVPFWN
jgi:hypothetical protein